MDIEIKKGSIIEVEADAIVNPANSLGYMGGGVAGVIKRIGGREIEREAIEKAPIKVGDAILTNAGKLNFKGVIHAPTMERPAMKIPLENVRLATLAALKVGDENGFSTIAIPGMGTGVGGVSKEDAAREMIKVIKEFHAKNLKKVILVDVDEEMVDCWRKVVRN